MTDPEAGCQGARSGTSSVSRRAAVSAYLVLLLAANCAAGEASLLQRIAARPGKCLACDGQGKCADCKGTGAIRKRCVECGGTGFVTTKERMQEAMATLAAADPAQSDFAGTSTISLAAALKRFDAAAAAVRAAPTSVRRDDAVRQLQEDAHRLFDGRRTVLTAVTGDIRLYKGRAALSLEEGYREIAGVAGDLKNSRLLVSRGLLHLAMEPADMRRILPGTKVRVSGILQFQHPTGMLPPTAQGREVTYLGAIGTHKSIGLISWRSAQCEIDGKKYAVVPQRRVGTRGLVCTSMAASQSVCSS